MKEYLMLFATAMLPVIASALLYKLNERTIFSRLKEPVKQLIYGLIFGGLAVLGTELGVQIEGATVNCRDAAVLTGGLFFGGPAGIIAGLIGGAERWIAVAWGAGLYARNACVISTVLAGFIAALLRRYIFEDKRPRQIISFLIGIVVEMFHFTMVFLTNLSNPEPALAIVRVCFFPMVIATGLSLIITSFVLTLLAGEKIRVMNEKLSIAQIFQTQLIVLVILALLANTYFTLRLQEGIATGQVDARLSQVIRDVRTDIELSTDEDLLKLCRIAKEQLGTVSLADLARQLNLTEINLVDQNGIITDSTKKSYIGFDMHFGVQSAAFLCLLEDTQEYVQDYGTISYEDDISRKYAGIKMDFGFLQVGYDAEQFQKNISSQISRAAAIHHVGEEGGVIILDRNMIIVSSADDRAIGRHILEEDLQDLPGDDVTFRRTVSEVKCFLRYSMAEGYYIVAYLPESEGLLARNTSLFVNSFAQILIFALLFGAIYLLIRNSVVKQMREVTGSLTRIVDGDLNVKVNVHSSEEFSILSDDINTTVDTLKRYISEASARIDTELEFARSIQSSALPGTFPAFPWIREFELYALMTPAKEVGGDFYDFYLTDERILNFVIADVSGKGIGAAMFMMRAMTELRNLTQANHSVSEVFGLANTALCEGNDSNMFVTAWQGSLDPDSGKVSFANAGHNPPLILHADGRCEYLRTRGGFVLAGLEEMSYSTQSLSLEPDDVLFLYTDGVTEAANANRELYGEERLLQALSACRGMKEKEICESIKADVDAFTAGAPQSDDMTMLALYYRGAPWTARFSCEKASLDDIPRAISFAETELQKLGCPHKSLVPITIAVDEIFSNIVKYAYPNAQGPVDLLLKRRETPKSVWLRFEDKGIPYNPLEEADPDVTLPAEKRSVGGLGIFMVKKLVDDVSYSYENGKNILTLIKEIE